MTSLSDSLRDTFDALFAQVARPGIILTPHHSPEVLPVGASKIGGCPDVPPVFEWPTFMQEDEEEPLPLAFLAQMNLAELAPLDVRQELPPSGMLYFFYEMATECWGTELEDKGCGRVVYVEDSANLTRGNFPDGLLEEYRLPEHSLTMEGRPIPPHICNVVEDEAMADMFADACGGDWDEAGSAIQKFRPDYIGLRTYDWGGYDIPVMLLGYPDVMQDAMERDCEILRNGGEETDETAEASRDWVQLFQFCNVFDEESGEFRFGDISGVLYFWIRKQDLAAQAFDKCWLMCQCD